MQILSRSKTLQWTAHSRMKMRQYGLSEQRVKRIIHSPERIEEGIAPKTIAMMQPASLKTVSGKRDWKQELWVMVEELNQKSKVKGQKLKVISVWRYPGRTKPGDSLPPEILRELKAIL